MSKESNPGVANLSARGCIVEMVNMILYGLCFCLAADEADGKGYGVVDAPGEPGYLTVAAIGVTEEALLHKMWAEAMGKFCRDAAPGSADADIVSFVDGRVRIRVPDLATAQFLLRYVQEAYASHK